LSVNQHRDRRDARVARRPRPPFPPAPGRRREAHRPLDRTGLDQQQAILLETLQRAGGGTVSYEELRDRGIEYPASVVSELELSGWPLERSFGDPSRGSRRLGVRLDPRDAGLDDVITPVTSQATQPLLRHQEKHERGGLDVPPARAALAKRVRLTGAALAQLAAVGAAAGAERIRGLPASTGPQLRSAVRDAGAWVAGGATAVKRAADASGRRTGADARRSRLSGRTHARWLAPALLIIVAGIAAALIAGSGSSATGDHRHAPPLGPVRGATQAAMPKSPAPSRHRPRRAAISRPSASATSPSAPPAASATAAQLQARGHTLLAAGALQAATQLLRHAAAASGGSVVACREPVSEACLTYGYALFDLGRALRLSNQAAAAVPVLEDRLKIANQRSQVFAELQLARREAEKAGSSASAVSPAPSRVPPPPPAKVHTPPAGEQSHSRASEPPRVLRSGGSEAGD
jgi:hypothetical protein